MKFTLMFLNGLSQNNNREWFEKHRAEYDQSRQEMLRFADELLEAMHTHDLIETTSGKKSLFRIYRDVRFSKDKTPYNSHFAMGMTRATKWLRGSYYLHIKPGASMVAGGFWGPNKEDLRRIRTEIAADAAPFRKILTAPDFDTVVGYQHWDK